MIVIYRNGRSSIYHHDGQLSEQKRTNPRGWCNTKLSHDSLQWFSHLVQYQVNLNKITEKREGCPPSPQIPNTAMRDIDHMDIMST